MGRETLQQSTQGGTTATAGMKSHVGQPSIATGTTGKWSARFRRESVAHPTGLEREADSEGVRGDDGGPGVVDMALAAATLPTPLMRIQTRREHERSKRKKE